MCNKCFTVFSCALGYMFVLNFEVGYIDTVAAIQID